jgi:hypothetical protein
MPRVPTYDSFQATPNTLPQPHMAMPEMPDVAGQQAQQMGRAMMAGGQSIGQVALDMQQQANQLRVDDALNQAKEAALRLTYDKDAGFINLKGLNALKRPGGKPLADEYSDILKRNIDDIGGSLGNDAQRQSFALRSNDLLTAMRGHAIQHEAREYETYALSTSEGIQSTALREIGLNWQNPDTVNSAVERIRAETYRQAQLLGKSAEWQDAQARKLTSNAHKVALLSALEQNDPSYADAYLKKYSAQMDADDILSVRGHITKEMDAQTSQAAALQAAREMAPRFAGGSESDRAFHVAVGAESGYRQFNRDGTPKTSKAGRSVSLKSCRAPGRKPQNSPACRGTSSAIAPNRSTTTPSGRRTSTSSCACSAATSRRHGRRTTRGPGRCARRSRRLTARRCSRRTTRTSRRCTGWHFCRRRRAIMWRRTAKPSRRGLQGRRRPRNWSLCNRPLAGCRRALRRSKWP